MPPDQLSRLLEGFDPISLEDLDRRAALLRRVDRKYALEYDVFLDLLRRLRANHQVLEIDGRRVFAYRTMYFETPDLRCFNDHVEDRRPRFKARTRLYEDTGACVFEVKLKLSDDETDKRQIDYAPQDADRITDEARQCLNEALERAGLEPPAELGPALRTSFSRITFAAVEGPQRVTCDLGVRLASPQGAEVAMRDGLMLLETKSDRGDSPSDRMLAEMGYGPISLSKYRVGMSLAGGARGRGPQPGSELFV